MKQSARVRANRCNARLSTGPRSKAGKQRVAANAMRHGLAVPIAAVPEIHATAARLARLIVDSDSSAVRVELARRLAEAQMDLNRVRQARTALLKKPVAHSRNAKTERPYDAEHVAAIFCDLSKELARLDRYERRALSRRKFAIRALDSLPLWSP